MSDKDKKDKKPDAETRGGGGNGYTWHCIDGDDEFDTGVSCKPGQTPPPEICPIGLTAVCKKPDKG